EEEREEQGVHRGGAGVGVGGEEHDVEPIAALERALTENEKANTMEPAMLIKSESMSAPEKEGVDEGDGSAHLPAAAVRAEGEKSESTIPPLVAEEHKAVPPELSAASSAKEAGPASASASAEDEHTPETHATPAHVAEGKHGAVFSAVTSPAGPGSETAGATAHGSGEALTSREGESVAREAE
ncbi:hypothetical protein LTR48_006790, partial [Friedmanniomyces endolithicus]